MIANIVTEAVAARTSDPGSYTKAILNILADFSEKKDGLADVQKAILNMMEDSSDEKKNLGNIQRAILNILEDTALEKTHLDATHKGILNLLDDSAEERMQLELIQRAVLNILDDIDIEKKKVEQINRAMAGEIELRKQAEEEVKKLNDELERRVIERTAQLEASIKELEAFSYSVSHDLRAPLRAVDGFSRIILDEYSNRFDDEGRRLLNVVRSNTQKMGQLIDDILQFSRMGRKEMSMAEVDMERLINDVYAEIKLSVPERNISFIVKPLVPAHGDPSMLRQVISNLLSNAVKFTRPKDTAFIEIGMQEPDTGQEARGDRENIYCVKDNGVGFDMKYADKLFGVFQRLHGMEEFEGTGIGLAIIKRIITRHNGRVWVEGKVNEGAVFCFSLPKECRF